MTWTLSLSTMIPILSVRSYLRKLRLKRIACASCLVLLILQGTYLVSLVKEELRLLLSARKVIAPLLRAKSPAIARIAGEQQS